MKTLLNPKLDLVFKLLFTNDPAILLDLVNTVLDFPDRRHIVSLTIKNPIILPEEITEKLIILDIQAEDAQGRYYDIEMQVRKYTAYPERSLYYLSRIYAGQLDRGEQYHRLKPVIGMHFLNYDLFTKHNDFRFCFDLRDARYPQLQLTEHLRLYIFELAKFERQHPHFSGTKLFEWLHFFNHAEEEGEANMQTQYTNPSIHQAFHVLEKLSADQQTRLRAQVREKALQNALSELSAARDEGRDEGLDEGLSLGELIGEIRSTQRFLQQPVILRESLAQQDRTELETLLETLTSQLESQRQH